MSKSRTGVESSLVATVTCQLGAKRETLMLLKSVQDGKRSRQNGRLSNSRGTIPPSPPVFWAALTHQLGRLLSQQAQIIQVAALHEEISEACRTCPTLYPQEFVCPDLLWVGKRHVITAEGTGT